MPMAEPNPEERTEGASQFSERARGRTGSLEGERRVVTILFCDVAGSTRMAENLDPEDWAEIMDSAFEYMIGPVVRYEGTVARLMGDGILALFGAPTSHEDDSQRALLASLEILEGLQPFRDRVKLDHGLDFNVRIGVNTGPVVVGEVGSSQAGEYTAMGDAVNLASRLQSSAVPGSVHVSESTFRATAPIFEFEALGVTDIRGRDLDIATYRLIGLKERPGRLRGVEGLASPLVGRSEETSVLNNAVSELLLGRGGIVILLGDAGLGKTRLIEEAKKRWADSPAEIPDQGAPPGRPAWWETRGISYDRFLPYSLFVGRLRELLGITGDDTPASSRLKIAEYTGAIKKDDSEAMSLALEALLGVSQRGHPPPDGEAVKRQLISFAKDYLRRMAIGKPTIAVFDDLHWADPASVEVLQSLLQLTDELPILLVCSMRPDRRTPGWQIRLAAETEYPHRYSEIKLKELSPADSDSLVNNLLTVSDLPRPLQQMILEKAEGNPFFIEEVIRSLIENEIIAQEESRGRWVTLRGVEEIEIPDNLQSLIISRIDRLSPADRRTLQLAAVIGRNFQLRVLERMDPTSESLNTRLNALERMGLVNYTRDAEADYRFVHELTRDAAYHSVLRRQRREYHLLAGQAIEAIYPESLEEEAHRLANHFEQGRQWELALHYYRMAAEAAARLFANAEAADQYGRAIALARRLGLSPAEVAPLYLRRGRILEESSRFLEAIESYQELEGIAIDHTEPAVEAEALIPQMTLHVTPTSEQDLDKARRLGERTLGLAERLDDPRIESRTLWNLMMMETNLTRNYPKAIELGQSSLAIARRHHLEETLAFTLHDLSRAYQQVSQIEEALDCALEANQLFRRLNQSSMVIDNLTLTADIYFVTGELEQARKLGEEALHLSRKTGSLWGQGYSSFTLTPIYYELGEVEKGIRTMELGREVMAEANFIGDFHLFTVWILSWGYGFAGDFEMAHRYAEKLVISPTGTSSEQAERFLPQIRGLTLAYLYYLAGELEKARREIGDILGEDAWIFAFPPPFQSLIASLMCEVALAIGEYQPALTLLDTAVREARESGARPYMADLLLGRGEALLRTGHPSEGWATLELAVEEAMASKSPRARLKTFTRLSQLEGERDNPQDARGYHDQAREELQKIAETFTDSDLRSRFLKSSAAAAPGGL